MDSAKDRHDVTDRCGDEPTLCSIALLGGFAVRVKDCVLKMPTRKTAALLAMLSFRAGQEFRREWLIAELWPDSLEESARANLRQALLMVRRFLDEAGFGPEAVAANRQTISLNGALFRTDVLEFEALVAAAGQSQGDERLERLRLAVEAYSGSLLLGFDEAWIMPERLRLERLFVTCAVELAGALSEVCLHSQALPYAQRAVEADPFSESARIAVVGALLGLGQPSEARQQVLELERLLRDDLGAELSASTRRTFEHWFETMGEGDPRPAPLLENQPASSPKRSLRRLSRLFVPATACALVVIAFIPRWRSSGPGAFGRPSAKVQSPVWPGLGQGSAITDMGPGYIAMAINASGQVVGGSSLPSARPAFRWSPTTMMNCAFGSLVPLPPLPVGGRDSLTSAFGINNAGTVVGVSDGRATMWKNGEPEALEADLAKGSCACAINSSGDVVGYSSFVGNGVKESGVYPLKSVATFWRDGNATQLPTPRGSKSAFAAGINDKDQIVGRAVEAAAHVSESQIEHATLWQGGEVYGLGVLPGYNKSSSAVAINATGSIAGSSWGMVNGAKVEHAFLWTPAATNGKSGRMEDLGTLPGLGLASSHALAINGSGQVVGFCYSSRPRPVSPRVLEATPVGVGTPANPEPTVGNRGLPDGTPSGVLEESDFGALGPQSRRGFIWDRAHGIRPLDSLIPKSSAWHFGRGCAINDSGQIVGDAFDMGGQLQRAFLLTPQGENSGLVRSPSPTAQFQISQLGGGQPTAAVHPDLDVNPTNPLNIVASWTQLNAAFGNCAIFTAVTFDGGKNWRDVIVPGVTTFGGGDLFDWAMFVWPSFAPNGDLYLTYGLYVNNGNSGAIGLCKSKDGGLTWDKPRYMTQNDKLQYDDPVITADPRDSRKVYESFFVGQDDKHESKFFTRSLDGGQTWDTVRRIYAAENPLGSWAGRGKQISVLRDGALICLLGETPAMDTRAVTADLLRSRDGGLTWSAPSPAFTLPRAFHVTDPKSGYLILNSAPDFYTAIDPRNDHMYVVFEDNRFSHGPYGEIAFTMSADGGVTWSAPAPINRTPTSVPAARRQAFLPNVAVSADGTIGVTYYDLRHNSARPGCAADYWLITCHPDAKTSPTVRESWHETRLTDTSFDMDSTHISPYGIRFLGFHFGLKSVGKDFVAVWSMPTATSAASVFFRRVPHAAFEKKILDKVSRRFHLTVI